MKFLKIFRILVVLAVISGLVFQYPPESFWKKIEKQSPFSIISGGKIFQQVRVAYAGSAGPNNCSVGADNSSTGSVAWTNPNNACVGSQSTTATGLTSSSVSHYLAVTGFGFSIPAGSKISGIEVNVSRSTTANKGNRAIDNAARIIKGGVIGSTDKSDANQWSTTSATYGTTSDLWGETWTVADINASNFGFAVSAKSTGTNAINATVNAFITITVTYNAPSAAPTQDSPVNSATGVSVTPNFLATASDPESDGLGYRFTIYSNSGCTTVVSTHEQAVDSTGWSGQNGSCSGNPTSCYNSGTQGNFTLQAGDALANETQYWWRASVKDPDGSGTYVDSSTCNTFTTASANSLPVASAVSIDSAAASVTLIENTTKNVVCSATVTDNDGYANITSVEAKLFRTGVGAGAANDDNNHYTLSGDANCVPSGGSGNSENYTCTFSVQFFAEPTDAGSIYAADDWTCQVTPSDAVGAGTSSSDTIEMNTLIALNVSSPINYGTLGLGNDSGSSPQTATVTNTGNALMDPQVSSAAAMSCTSGTIPVANQKYASATFTYSSGGTALSGTPTTLNLNLPKPTSTTPVTDNSFWGIAIPATGVAGSCTGSNVFTAVAGS